MIFFNRNLVYPCDEIGVYTTIDGELVEIGHRFEGERECLVTVKTECGLISAVIDFKWTDPQIGDIVKVKVYDSGGGWYPDNVVIAWTSKKILSH